MQYLGILIVALLLAVPASAQRGPITAPIDPELERMADHNLEIADFYFSKKKAYNGARDRLLEIVAVYPEYTKIDEVFFLLGEIFFRTDEPAKAREYYQRLLDERPQSEFAEKARKRLPELPEAPPATPPPSGE